MTTYGTLLYMATAALRTENEDWVPDFSFGDRLRVVRRRRRRTQDEMAALLGVKKVTYGSWEAGTATPPHDEVVKIARRLYLLDRVPQWWTLGAEDPTSHGQFNVGSEGWEFESLRAHPASSPRRERRRNHMHVVPLRLVSDDDRASA